MHAHMPISDFIKKIKPIFPIAARLTLPSRYKTSDVYAIAEQYGRVEKILPLPQASSRPSSHHSSSRPSSRPDTGGSHSSRGNDVGGLGEGFLLEERDGCMEISYRVQFSERYSALSMVSDQEVRAKSLFM